MDLKQTSMIPFSDDTASLVYFDSGKVFELVPHHRVGNHLSAIAIPAFYLWHLMVYFWLELDYF